MRTVETKCTRCGGTGLIPRFGHILKGMCFKCQGSGVIRVRARRDGTVDHDHRLSWQPGYVQSTECADCGLPVANWPKVIPAHWWGDFYDVYLPNEHGGSHHERVPADTRRGGQSAVRTLVAARLDNFRIKWIDRTR